MVCGNLPIQRWGGVRSALEAVLVGAMALPAAAQTEPASPNVAGRVVDADGQPVIKGVRVASFWSWSTPEAGQPSGAMAVDDKGQFEGHIEFYGQPQALIAYSDDYALAGVVTVQPDAAGVVAITLSPSIPVSMSVRCSELGGDAGWVNSYWMLGDTRPLMATAKDGQVGLRLPRADVWKYWFYGQKVKSVTKEVAIDAATREINLDPIDFKATFVALNTGKTVDDWHVTDARGVPLNASQISDFKGKWVLVEFWGFW